MPQSDHPHAALDLRAVDRLIAEKIMELTPRQRQWGVGHLLVRRTEWLDRDGHVVSDMPGEFTSPFHVAPYYTSTWDAAGQVVERMLELGWDWNVAAEAGSYEVTFCRGPYTEEGEPDGFQQAIDNSLPTATCLAALAALGVDVPV